MDFIGGVGVPDDELSILRGRDNVPLVGGPVQGVYFRQMTLERSTGFHRHAWEGRYFV